MSSRTRSQPGQRALRGKQSGQPQRLGPDGVRRALLGTISREVDAAPVGRCEAFAFPRLAAPATPSIAVGNAIDLADGIRIFEQYAKIISDACKCHETSTVTQTGTFLSGGLLPAQLAWFERLRAPVQRSAVFEAHFERMLELFREARRTPASRGPPTSAEVYELQQTLPHVDPELVRLMLAIGRPSAPGYEAQISAHLLRTRPELSWLGHQEALDAWRDTGLLHPLLLAARHMPTLNDWLPVDMHEQASAWGDALTALNAARSAQDTRDALARVEASLDWGGPAGLAVAGLLDRLAVAMRVLSNAPAAEADLDAALARFPDWSGGPQRPGLGRVWKEARTSLEKLLPPSLLCPPLAGFRKATWGYHALTPTVDGDAIRFAERSLGWVEPHPDPSESGRAAAALEADAGVGKSKGCARLQDVLCRMGVIALSPEIGHLMMLAIEALDHLKSGASKIAPHEQQYCQTPALLLHFMSDTGLVSDDEDIQRLADHLFASLPAVTRVDRPLRLAGWRVDPPTRVVLYTGQGDVRTVLLDERSDAPRAGGVFALPPAPPKDPQADHAFRARLSDAMLAYLRVALRAPVTETVRADGNREHTHTALHEGLAEMALREPTLHTFVPLHQTSRWDNERQDVRYSESQLGANGHRFRDWFAVHQDPADPQKCRLDSHVAAADHYFATLFPWRRDDGGTEWVSVAASVEPQVRILQERGLGKGPCKDRATALLSSVKARFMQDLKLLPVRDPAHRIERRNTSVYEDSARGQVLICYAPTGDPDARIEFLAFGLRAP